MNSGMTIHRRDNLAGAMLLRTDLSLTEKKHDSRGVPRCQILRRCISFVTPETASTKLLVLQEVKCSLDCIITKL